MIKRVLSLIVCVMIVFSALTMTAYAQPAVSEDTYISADGFIEPVPVALDDESDAADMIVDRKTESPVGTGALEDDEIQVPQIHVTTENGNGVALIKADGYVNASISITDTDGSVLSDSCTFKVHGNTTAFDSIPKKAYTFKFSKKKDVLGMGKGKKWFLIANCYDPSLLRNYTAIDLARELGLAYTSEQKFVELWLDGSYRGCYTLYEPVQEGKDRVNIDIESNDGKKDFLIEYENMAQEDDVSYFTVDGLRFAVKDPDDTTDEQLEYINDTMASIVNTLKSGKREDAERVIDIDSFAKFYLVNEFMKNMDFDMSSVFYYYQDGILYAGPVWDFDKSSGNTDPNIGSSRATNSYKTDGIMQDKRTLYKYLGKQSWFTQEVIRVYEEHYDYIEGISAEGGLLDSLYEEYQELFARNFSVWDVRRKYTNYQNAPEQTYIENFEYFKDWCAQRNAWLYDYYDLFSYEFLRGDADGNGQVEVIDVTCIQCVISHLKCDVDDKVAVRAALTGSELNITDATFIQRYLADLGNPMGLDEYVKVKLR